MLALGRHGKITVKCGTPMKNAGLGFAIAIYIIIFMTFVNAVRWTAGYDAGPVTAFDLSVPGGYGDFGVDSWRLLSGVWFSLYYFPPQGGLTTILDFTLPKWWCIVMFAACCTVLVVALFGLAMLVRGTAVR
jgi:hypothetical protein